MASLSPAPNSSPSDAPPPQSSAPSPDPSLPSSPPPVTPSTPPPQPPVASSPPPTPIVDPPISSRPPPSQTSPPSASITPPAPPSNPPTNSTPPSSAPLPANTTPPALPIPPQKSPSPPPPQNSISPPPATTPPEPPISSPPPPISVPPPRGSTPPPATALPPSPSNASPPPGHTPTLPSQPTPSSPNTDTPPTVRPSQPTPRISPPPSGKNTGPTGPDSSNSKGGGIGPGVIVAIGVVVGIVMLILVWLAFCCFKKQRKGAPGGNADYVVPSSLGSSPTADANFAKAQVTVPLMGTGSSTEAAISSNGSGGLGNSRPWFAYEELLKATNGFSTQNLLGEGGFGSVYKGCLPDGREVAVKQLKVGGGQGEREFKAEVEIISRIHHRHLVSLVGYCIFDNQRLLVYDYVPNNTLHFHLHGEGRPVLDWAARVKIAAGAARGIAYLHEDCDPRIIHRDIKLSNILLDNNFEAKVSDFGLAKLALDTDTHVTTRVMGTFGYMAPEYASSGKLTEKSDVFSYGVVLLELITGRMAVDVSRPVGDESLVEWARPLLGHALANEDFDDLVDPRLEKNYVESEMFIMIEAAAACVRHSAGKRPRMGQLVRAFEGLTTSDLSNGMRVGESEAFNSSERAAEIKLFRRMAFGSQNYCVDFSSQSSLDS